MLKQIITADTTHMDTHIILGTDHTMPIEDFVNLNLRDGILIDIHIEIGMDTKNYFPKNLRY